MTSARGAVRPVEPSYVVPYSSVGSVFGAEEVAAIAEVLHSGRALAEDEVRDRFEERCARLLGVRYAFSMPSCSASLALAIHLLDLRPGDEVIATPQTYQATISPLLPAADVEVRFCDVDPETLNADPESVAGLADDRTAAIIVVHYGGLMADVGALAAVARRHGALLIEDAAHAFGARRHGDAPGVVGDIACFSFQGTKNVSTLGEGGLIVCSDDALAERIARIRDYEPDATFRPARRSRLGRWSAPTSGAFEHEKNAFSHDCEGIRHGGTNGVLSEAAAAVGLVQLDRLDGLVRRRAEICDAFDEAFGSLDGVRTQRHTPDDHHVHHLYTFFVDPDAGIDRERLIAAIERRGVEMVLRYFPLHLLPEWRFRGHRPGECPVAERVWFNEQVNLPCYPAMSDAQVDHVIDAVLAAVSEVRR